MQRCTALVWLAVAGSLTGCARSSDGRHATWWPFAGPPASQALAAAPATEQAAPAARENSSLAPAGPNPMSVARPATPPGSAPPPLPATAADGGGTTIEGLVEQLRASGALDPTAEAQLRQDLARTDPALWPLVAQQLRATAAYRRQAEGAPADHPHAARQVAAVAFPQPSAEQQSDAQPRGGQSEAAAAAGPPAVVLTGADVFADEPPPPTAFASDGAADAAAAPEALLPPEQQLPGAALRAAAGVPPSEALAGVPQALPAAPPAAQADQGSPAGQSLAPAAIPQSVAQPGAAVPAGLLVSAPGVPAPVAAQSAAQPIPDPASAIPPPGVSHAPVDSVQQPASAAAVPAVYVGEPVASGAAQSLPLAQAIAELERQTQGPARNAEEIRAHAALRLLYLSAGRRDDALKPIPGLPAGQQDFWLEEVYGLSTLLDAQQIADPAKRAVEARRHLDRALLRLADTAELLVYNLVFCTEVTSFGVYHESEKTEFRAGEEVLLYAEVENFRSEETEQGYHTALRSSYQILDAQGRRVTSEDFNLMEEHCQNPRRDFFVRYFLEMPERIYPGEYTLELTIEDSLSQKLGSGRIPFTIVE